MRARLVALRNRAYRAYFTHMPMGNIAERVWVSGRAELFYDGFRKGLHIGYERGIIEGRKQAAAEVNR